MPPSKKIFTPEMAYNRAAARCATAEYCLADWRSKFIMKGLSAAEAEKVLDRLVDEGFINEERYARAYVHDKALYDRWGSLKIKQALGLKRIDQQLIKEAIEQMPPETWHDNLLALLRQKKRSLKAETPYEERMKLLRTAASRGYEAELVYKVIEELCGEVEDLSFDNDF